VENVWLQNGETLIIREPTVPSERLRRSRLSPEGALTRTPLPWKCPLRGHNDTYTLAVIPEGGVRGPTGPQPLNTFGVLRGVRGNLGSLRTASPFKVEPLRGSDPYNFLPSRTQFPPKAGPLWRDPLRPHFQWWTRSPLE